MLISELISNLEAIKEKHGDIPCYSADANGDYALFEPEEPEEGMCYLDADMGVLGEGVYF